MALIPYLPNFDKFNIENVLYKYLLIGGQDSYILTAKDGFFLNGYNIFLPFDGVRLRVKFLNTNTGTSTLTINNSDAYPLKKSAVVELSADDIIAGYIYEVNFDGTNFQINIPPNATFDLDAALKAKTNYIDNDSLALSPDGSGGFKFTPYIKAND